MIRSKWNCSGIQKSIQRNFFSLNSEIATVEAFKIGNITILGRGHCVRIVKYETQRGEEDGSFLVGNWVVRFQQLYSTWNELNVEHKITCAFLCMLFHTFIHFTSCNKTIYSTYTRVIRLSVVVFAFLHTSHTNRHGMDNQFYMFVKRMNHKTF